MTKRSWATTALAAFLLGAAGCGGGDDGGSATTETDVAGTSRLTQEQWSAYGEAKATFLSARDAATTKLDECPDTSADEFSGCVGSTLDDLESAAAALGDTLTAFDGTVTGECASSAAALASYTAPYANAVQVLQEAIDAGNVAEIPAAKSAIQTLTQSGSEETQAFEEACAPA